MYQHTLVIGGTGMLSAASLALASRSRIMTSVARTNRSLAALNALLPASSATHCMLASDWTDPDDFLRALWQQLAKTEQPDLVLAWIHADELAIRFAAGLARVDPVCRFFHVLGSSTSDPLLVAATARERLSRSNIAYHQVILGYAIDDGAARWLTNEEISAGVLDALARAEPTHVVGVIQPWSSRS